MSYRGRWLEMVDGSKDGCREKGIVIISRGAREGNKALCLSFNCGKLRKLC